MSGTDGELDVGLRRRATVARLPLESFLHPGSIAVVGAGEDPNSIAGLLFRNLVDSRFSGVLLPVNKSHPSVQGVDAYPDLASCPVVPDLVVVCVPAGAVPDIVGQAGRVGVKAVCVISAGFAESGPDGAALEADLVREARLAGVRLVGPNCAGILNGASGSRFNATFSRVFPDPGGTSLVSQSGAVGVAVLEATQARGLGMGAFVSVGNGADLTTNDLLLHFGRDPMTDLILLYLESVDDPRSFLSIAQRVARHTPVVVLKAGRTDAGRRAAASHTAAICAADMAVDALLHQAGVVRARSIEEMLDLATALHSRPKLRGRRVGIVTNGGGPGILAADACETNGLVVPELSVRTVERLRSFLPLEASVANPVDMISTATAQQYGQAVRALASSSEVDVLLVIFNTPLLTPASEVAAELVAARSELGDRVGLVTVFVNQQTPPRAILEAGVASFPSADRAGIAVGRSVAWEERRGRPPGRIRRPEVDVAGVRRLVVAGRDRARDGWMASVDARALLEAYGIAMPRAELVSTSDEAARAQARLGCAVVVKAAAAIHKRDVGGLRLGLRTPRAAADAVGEIRAELARQGMGEAAAELLVQEQVESGQEMIVGFNRDPLAGPLVMVGLGGTLVELLGDVSLGLVPLTDQDVDDMLQSLRSYRLLTGYRGGPARDVGALHRVVHRVSALADDVPEIAEMDLNPVFVLDKGATAADIRIRLGSTP